MTLTSLDSRKRPRSCDEDDVSELGSQPLLKRINNLHIRSNASLTPGISGSNTETDSSQGEASSLQNGSVPLDYSCQESSAQSKVVDNANSPNVSVAPTYAPELNASENPFYYHVNNLLFQAHIQRLRRINNAGPNS